MKPRDPELPPRAEALLSQTDWVRTLVRGLGVDESAADDVVQSTWVAALTSPPRAAGEGASLRAWIARVARNFALRRIDRDTRRAARERDSAKEERLPSAADVVEREEARSQVVHALLEVHEPYRTTLLLRFYEGLEPRDIARVQKVPDSTVRNRLKRGLALLRERLEVSQGANWRQRCLLVLPALRARPFGFSAPPKWLAATAASGGVFVIKTFGIAAAVTLAAGGLYLAWDRVESKGVTRSTGDLAVSATGFASSGSAQGGAVTPSRNHASGASTQLVSAIPGSTRVPAASAADDVTNPSDDGHRFVLRGRLISPDGKPLKPAPNPLRIKTILAEKLAIDMNRLSALERDSSTGVHDDEQVRGGRQLLDYKVAQGVDLADDGDQAGTSVPREGVSLDNLAGDEPASTESSLKTMLRSRSFAAEGGIAVRARVALQNYTFALADWSPFSRSAHVLVASAAGDARELDIDAEGAFEFGDLRPDHWRLFATAPGFVSRRMEFDVGRDEKEKRLDVTLAPSPDLRVKLVTPDGHDLIKAVSEDPNLGRMFAPVPFAMRDDPGPRVADLGDAPARPFASASWRRHEDPEDKSIGDATGVLQLSDPLPLHVGISVRGAVIEQRLVASGTEEVVFVVPLDRIRALVSGVRVRLVSARDRLPIEEAMVSIEGCDSTLTDSQGEALVEHVPPGSHKISFEADGVERRSEWIEVQPGPKNDLGVRELGSAIRIAGRVVDENGTPVQVSLHLRPLDAASPGHSLPSADEAEADGDGRFVFERAGRRRYLLSVDGEDWAAPVQTIDAREGSVPEVVVHVARCGELKLTFPIEPPPGANYVVDTSDGIPIAIEPADGWQPLSVRLGNGEYRVRIVAGGRTLWTRHVIVQPGQMIAFDENAERR